MTERAAPETIAVQRSGDAMLASEGATVEQQFVLTEAARGPWDPSSAHGGAPSALLTRAIEQRAATDEQRVSAVSFTFFGPVPLGEVTIRTRIVKPGRRLQIVRGELLVDGRTAMEARGVLLRRGRIALPAGVGMPWPELAPPEAVSGSSESYLPEGVRGFHPTAMEIRLLDGGLQRLADTASAWLRLRLPLLAGEAPSGVQRAVAASDFGNGLAHPVSFDDYLFVNCDLNVSLHRDPAGEWIGVRARTELDRAGTGLTTTELHDAAGRFGTATQTLFVDTR